MTFSADVGSSGRRVLVTGASGFIGSHLVRALVGRGDQVVALVRPGFRPWRLDGVLEELELLEADIGELDPRSPALRGVSVVHHLAAAGVDPREADAARLVEANVGGTLRLLAAARALDLERFVYCGSCFEYGAGSRVREDAPLRPRSPYAASKSAGWLLAEAAAAADGLPLVSLRPFTVYGPFEAPHRLVPSCILSSLDGGPIAITRGDQRRDFVFAEDAVEAFVAAADAPAAVGRTFNVCSGVETSVRELAATVAALTRNDARVELGAVPLRPGEAAVLSGDPAAAQAILDFQARTPLRNGLERTLAWFRDHRHLYATVAAAS